MKKIIAIALLSLICVSCAACSNSGSSSESSKAESSQSESSKAESSKTDIDEPTTADITSDGDLMTLDEYAEFLKSQVDLSNIAYNVDVDAEGDTMVYQYTCKFLRSAEEVAQTKAEIESGLEGENVSDAVESDKNYAKQYTGIDIKIKYLYKNTDGSVIFERTF